ncbi:MAG: hypothetical protein A2X45_09745 [Lentisphaerae bacterium GWF2_50_93]|nr:MAG: hypothetical protein A2X45_09745 [Lentisphaerae bacterium GWF2_50_93]
MPVKKAIKAYSEEKLNCAQSVLRGFQKDMGISDEEIVEAKKLGGGRAPGGKCGALHSALELLENDLEKKELSATFAQKAGAEDCRLIRAMKKISCGQCVEHASSLLADIRQQGEVISRIEKTIAKKKRRV